MPCSFHPVLLIKVVKTYFAVLSEGADDRTAIMMVVKDTIERYSVAIVILGRILPYTLNRYAATLNVS